MKNRCTRQRHLATVLLVPCAISHAEISTDGTMGAAANLNGPDYAITEDLGTRVGNNLFHSFYRFNISTGESATFSGAPEINNVIGRVTGGERSSINGAIRSTIPNADIYLINPAGIVFGEDAILDINGSFHASTASYIQLGEDGHFDATNPGNTTLSIAPPSAFGFLGTPTGISIDKSNLATPPGTAITLAGGDITMQDAILYAPSGQINVASVASAGEALITPDGLDTSSFPKMGNVEIRHEGNFYSRPLANLDTSGDTGGVIKIRAGRFIMDNGFMFSDNLNGGGGHIDIDAEAGVTLSNEALITTDTYANGSGGRITVKTSDLSLKDGGVIQTDNYGSGPGGNIEIKVSGSISMSGSSPDQPPYRGNIQSGLYAGSFGPGNGSTITVEARDVTIEHDGKIELNASFGDGNAGKLDLNAETVNIANGGLIQTDTFGAGNAGTVSISVDRLQMTGGGTIAATTRGPGNAGEVVVTANETAAINGSNDVGPSGIFTNSFDAGDSGSITITADKLAVTNGAAVQSALSGNTAKSTTTAGDIRINVADLLLASQGQISTQTENSGHAGNITINARKFVNILSENEAVQSGFFSTTIGEGDGGIIDLTAMKLVMDGGAINVSSNNIGKAGAISAQLGSLELQNGAQISTSVAGAGNGGDLAISVADKATINGQSGGGFSSGLYSTTSNSGIGGNIEFTANTLSIDDHGLFNAESTGDGNAGNVSIVTGHSVNLDKGFIRTRAVSADGGNIAIDAPYRVYLRNSEITTSVENGFGNGGNITIDPEFVILNNSRIIANAYGGNGGNILIVTNNFIPSTGSLVDASSRFGLDGTVIIRSPETDLSSSITDLPESFFDVSALLREPCAARRSVNQSSFIVRGRATIPPGPMTSLPLAELPLSLSVNTGATGQSTPAVATKATAGVELTGLSDIGHAVSALIDCTL